MKDQDQEEEDELLRQADATQQMQIDEQERINQEKEH